jgi:4a-hydroxytetrahydrobiopterin dehydratase
MVFINWVAALAERANHHPDMTIRYNEVTVSVWTHSDGGLTTKDFALARGIDAL